MVIDYSSIATLSFIDIPIALQDAKYRRSAALREGGYQGEKRDFPPDCKRE